MISIISNENIFVLINGYSSWLVKLLLFNYSLVSIMILGKCHHSGNVNPLIRFGHTEKATMHLLLRLYGAKELKWIQNYSLVNYPHSFSTLDVLINHWNTKRVSRVFFLFSVRKPHKLLSVGLALAVRWLLIPHREKQHFPTVFLT